jgi:acyl-CoA hydrolase
MEQAAFIVASRVCRGADHLLTASMDSVTFLKPTRVGDSM